MIVSNVLKVSLFIGLPAVAFAQQGHGGHAGHGAPHASNGHSNQAAMARQAVPPAAQKTCPVTGKPVSRGVSIQQDGEQVSFCCPRCVDAYKKDTVKYAPALYRQLYTQRVQVKCPVMGGDVNPDVFLEHEGQKINFCCRGCDAKFEKDPDKYAAALKEVYTEQVHCPVSGQVIDPQHSLRLGKGAERKTVYFCCEDCIPRFKADPDKYSAAVLPAAGLIAHGRIAKDDIVLCPVCPDDANAHHRGAARTVVHEGKAYFLSGADCEKAFKADPDKYVGKLTRADRQVSEGSAKPVHAGCSCH